MNLVDKIKEYYAFRGLPYPNFDNSMKFVMTELAEVYELDLARIGGWVRNNPQNKPTFSKEDLSEELGDAIMMLIVAGIAEGVDPVASLIKKIDRKMSTNPKILEGRAEVTILTEEEVLREFGKVYHTGGAELAENNPLQPVLSQAVTVDKASNLLVEFQKYREAILNGEA